jgi:light-regulated signal transduction histidine kinase (bacteriophytochrome)
MDEDPQAVLELRRLVAQQKQALDALTEEMSAFSYSISHDLRAPLRGIDGFSSALLEDYADRLDDNGRKYLERVRAAAARMGQMIDDLLALSRLTRTDLQRGRVDLTAVARQALEVRQAAEPGRRVEVTIAGGLVSNGDERQLTVLMEHLLGNAWKFTAKAVPGRIEVGSTPTPAGTAYFVRDNGIGFDMGYAERLFGAFQRLQTDFEGRGIGLATVRRIVHRHGGRAWAESRPGEGAIFYFTLEGEAAPG